MGRGFAAWLSQSQVWIEKRLREGYEMGYVFGLREGLSPVAQPRGADGESLRCQWALTRSEERSAGVVGFRSDRKIAAPDTPYKGVEEQNLDNLRV